MANPIKLDVILEASDKFTKPIRQAMGESTKFSEELAGLRREMRDLGTAQQNLKAFDKLQTTLAGTNSALEKSRNTLSSLETQQRNNTDGSKSYTREVERERVSIKKLEVLQQKESSTLSELKTKLESAKVNTSDLSAAQQQLTQKTTAVREKLINQSSAMDSMRESTKATTSQLSELRQAESKIASSLAMQNKIIETNEALKTAENRLEKVTQQHKDAFKPSQKLTKQYETAQQKIVKVTESHKRQAAALSSNSQRLNDAERHVESLRREYDQSKRPTEALTESLKQAETTLINTRKEHTKLTESVKRSSVSMSKAETKLESLKAEHKSAKQHISNTTQAHKNHSEALSKNTQKLSTAERNLADLKREYQATKQPTEALTKSLRRAETTLESTRSKQNELTSQISKSSTSMATAKTKLESLGSEYSNADKKLSSITQSHKQNTEALSKNASKVSESERNLQRLRTEYTASKQPTEALTKSLKRAETTLENTRTKQARLTEALSRSNTTLSTAKTKLDALKRQYEGTHQPSERLRKSFESAQKQVKSLTTKQDDQRRSLSRLKTELSSAGHGGDDLAETQRKISKATAAANTQLDEQSRKLDQLRQKERQHAQQAQAANRLRQTRDNSLQRGQAMVTTGGAAMYAGARAASFIGQSGQGSSAVADIAITADLDDSQIDEVRDKIGDLIKEAHQKKINITAGLGSLLTDGMDYSDAMGMLGDVAKTATAADAAIQDIAKTSFSLNASLGIAPEQMGKALDMLVVGGKAGAFELNNMAKYFPTLTAEAKKLGMQGEDAVATLGAALQIAKRGAGDPAEAANNMKNFLAKMTAPDTVKKFGKFGVDLQSELEKATAKGINPIERMLELIEETTGGDNFKMGELFADMQVKSFITPMLADLEDYKKIKAEMLSADGNVQTDLNRRVELDPTIANQDLTESLNHLRDQAIVPLLPTLTEMVNKITAIIKPVSEWIQANPELAGTIMQWTLALGGSIAAIGMLTFIMGTLAGPLAFVRYGFGLLALSGGKLGGAMTALSKVLPWIGRGIALIGRAVMLNPIGLLVTALVGGAYLIYKNWDKLVNWWNTTTWQEKTLSLIPTPLKLAYELAMTAIKWWNGETITSKDMPVTTGILQTAYDLGQSVWNWWNGETPKTYDMNVGTDLLDKAFGLAKKFANWWDNLSLKSLVPDIKWPSMPKWLGGSGGKQEQAASNANNHPLHRSAAASASQAPKSPVAPSDAAGAYAGVAMSQADIIAQYGGNRATGGPVNGGSFYRVNEQGPELLNQGGDTYLMMGKANGIITPLTSSGMNDPVFNDLSQPSNQQSSDGKGSGQVVSISGARARNSSTQQSNTKVNQTISITINPSAGMNEQDIAEAVAQALRQQQREIEDQYNARYHD